MSVYSGPKMVTSGLVACLDAANPVSYSPNVFPNPSDIAAFTGFSGNALTMSRDTSVSPSPAGGIPIKMAMTGNDAYSESYGSSVWSFATAAVDETWTISGYMKASVATGGGFYAFGANSSGSVVELINPMWTITTEWQRFSHSFTFTNATVAAIQIRLEGSDLNAAGKNIWFDGIQVEKASAATRFNPFYNQNALTFKDISQNTNNGTLLNGTVFSDTSGGALTFDGVNDYVEVSSSSSLNSTGAITLSSWFKLDTAPAGEIAFIRKQLQWQLGLSAANTIRCLVYPTAWTTSNDVSYTFSNNVWYNMVMTFDGSNMKIYVNSVLVKTAAAAGSITTNTNPVSIGYGSLYLDGNISNAVIYNRALSDLEIQQNFNALRGRYGI